MSSVRIQNRGMTMPVVSANKRLLFLLIGVFLILAPASVSGAASIGGLNLKWVRVGVLMLMMFTGLRWFRLPSLTDLSGKILLMASVFTLASLWSTSPLWALLFKGMLVCAVCASVSLANCLRTEADFRVLARTLTTSALMGALIVGYLIFISGDSMMWKGRLVVAEMNANSMGLSAAIFALLCLFHLLIRDQLFWRVLAVLLIGVMSVLVVYSGSRAALLTVAAGVLLLVPAMAGTRRNAIGLTIVSVLSIGVVSAVWFLSASEPEVASFDTEYDDVSSESLRMIDSMTKDTRMKIWRDVTNTWMEENLVLGAGWLHRNNRWTLVQSSYLQVVLEAGLPGLFCLVVFFLGAATTLYRALHYARTSKGFGALLLYLFAATFFAVAFHGIFESAAVVGSSPNAILLGFSAAQLDIQLRSAVSGRRRARAAGGQNQIGRQRPPSPLPVEVSGNRRRPPDPRSARGYPRG